MINLKNKRRIILGPASWKSSFRVVKLDLTNLYQLASTDLPGHGQTPTLHSQIQMKEL